MLIELFPPGVMAEALQGNTWTP